MMPRIRGRLRALIRDETGSTLLDTMVGTIVTAATIGVIALSIFGYLMASQSLSTANQGTGVSASADTLWRSDATQAFSVTSSASSNVTFTYAGSTVPCKQSTWTIATINGVNQITDTSTSFDNLDTSVTPAVCSGDQLGKTSRVVIPDAGANPSFTFTNLGGRPITLSSAGGSLGAGTQPAQVSVAHWNSTVVGKAVLQAQIGGLTVRSSQLTPQVTRGGTPNKPGEQVSGQ